MDLGTILGILLGITLILTAILQGGNPSLFMNWQGSLIVIGGTTAATLIRFPVQRVFRMFSVVRNAFRQRLPTPDELIDEMIQIARVARKEGVLALEDYRSEDEFLHQGIQLIVDGSDTESIQEILTTDIRYLQRRHKDGQDILKCIGEASPAFGMIGTLIGLVMMLSNMDDITALGPAMAVAILTTLYGALIAHLLALPLAKKLEVRSRQESLNRELMLMGMMSIQRGDNPRIMATVMRAFLSKANLSKPGSEGPREVKAA